MVPKGHVRKQALVGTLASPQAPHQQFHLALLGNVSPVGADVAAILGLEDQERRLDEPLELGVRIVERPARVGSVARAAAAAGAAAALSANAIAFAPPPPPRLRRCPLSASSTVGTAPSEPRGGSSPRRGGTARPVPRCEFRRSPAQDRPGGGHAQCRRSRERPLGKPYAAGRGAAGLERRTRRDGRTGRSGRWRRPCGPSSKPCGGGSRTRGWCTAEPAAG